jgi:hypothetical protein
MEQERRVVWLIWLWVGLSCQDGGGCLTLEPGFIGRAGASEGHGHGTGGEYGKTH